jgi:hypothetical protein
MSTARFDRDAVEDVIAAMEHYDHAWHKELADFLTADGDIDERRHGEYEHTKDDHAWPVLEQLPHWISTLKAALGTGPSRRAAPEAAPETQAAP